VTRALYLFDIDGTLLRAGGAGARALDAAFVARHGVHAAMRGIDAGGRTDPWLVAQAFERALGHAPSDAEIAAILDAYLVELDREMREVRVLPYVNEVIAWLRGEPVGLWIATGNVLAGARMKLERAGIADQFGFGGYGDDSGVRAELVARGIERGRALAGDVPDERIVVVGDTAHDVSAAKACGVRCVAVATGAATREALDATGADVVIDDLGGLRSWHEAAW